MQGFEHISTTLSQGSVLFVLLITLPPPMDFIFVIKWAEIKSKWQHLSSGNTHLLGHLIAQYCNQNFTTVSGVRHDVIISLLFSTTMKMHCGISWYKCTWPDLHHLRYVWSAISHAVLYLQHCRISYIMLSLEHPLLVITEATRF